MHTTIKARIVARITDLRKRGRNEDKEALWRLARLLDDLKTVAYMAWGELETDAKPRDGRRLEDEC